MTDFSNKPVLITGCSSGIGLATAETLKSRGYPVFASARKHADVERLREKGFESALQLDVDDSESIQAAVSHLLEQTSGRIYGLFNNGAYGQPGAVEDLTRETLRQQFETNLFGWHELTCALLPVMRQQGEGRIIQNSSILGFAAMKYRGAYNASKYALEGLTDTLRLELKGTGVFVSLVEPGPIESQFRANAYQKWQENIDVSDSFHKEAYEAMVERFKKPGPAVPFTLKPEAVVKRVIHALESNRPQPRYYVTLPTYLFGALKRLLPTRTLDRLADKY